MTRSAWTLMLLAGLVAITLALPAHAEVYRWVDDDGVTQYSAHPPPDVDAERIDTAAGIAEDPDPPAEDEEELAASPNDEADDEPETVDEYCEQAREEFELLQSDHDLQVEGEGGELRALDDEQREEWREMLREQIEQHCS